MLLAILVSINFLTLDPGFTRYVIVVVVAIVLLRLSMPWVLLLSLVSGFVSASVLFFSDHGGAFLLKAALTFLVAVLVGVLGAYWARRLENGLRAHYWNCVGIRSNAAVLEDLLGTILPSCRIPLLLSGQVNRSIDKNDSVSAVFVVISGISDVLDAHFDAPLEAAAKLDAVIRAMDELTARHNLYKVSSTVEGTYLAVAGLPLPHPDGPDAARDAAVQLAFAFIAHFRSSGAFGLHVKVGVGIGPAAGGIVGLTRPYYQVISDTVNVASRLASTGLPGTVQCLTDFVDRISLPIRIQENGLVMLKGKGYIGTLFLTPPIQRRCSVSVVGISSPTLHLFPSSPSFPPMSSPSSKHLFKFSGGEAESDDTSGRGGEGDSWSSMSNILRSQSQSQPRASYPSCGSIDDTLGMEQAPVSVPASPELSSQSAEAGTFSHKAKLRRVQSERHVSNKLIQLQSFDITPLSLEKGDAMARPSASGLSRIHVDESPVGAFGGLGGLGVLGKWSPAPSPSNSSAGFWSPTPSPLEERKQTTEIAPLPLLSTSHSGSGFRLRSAVVSAPDDTISRLDVLRSSVSHAEGAEGTQTERESPKSAKRHRLVSLATLIRHIDSAANAKLSRSLTFKDEALEREFRYASASPGMSKRMTISWVWVLVLCMTLVSIVGAVVATHTFFPSYNDPIVITSVAFVVGHGIACIVVGFLPQHFYRRHEQLVLSSISAGVLIGPTLLFFNPTHWQTADMSICILMGLFIPMTRLRYCIIQKLMPLLTVPIIVCSFFTSHPLSVVAAHIISVVALLFMSLGGAYFNEKISRLSFLEYVHQVTTSAISRTLVDDLFPREAVKLFDLGALKATLGLEKSWTLLSRAHDAVRGNTNTNTSQSLDGGDVADNDADDAHKDSGSGSDSGSDVNQVTQVDEIQVVAANSGTGGDLNRTSRFVSFSNVAIVVLDFVEFTAHASEMADTTALFKHMHSVMSLIDQVIENHDFFKVDIVGDSYLCTTNVFSPGYSDDCDDPTQSPSDDAVNFALDAIEHTRKQKWPNGDTMRLRAGVHVGDIVFGFFGSMRPRLLPFGRSVEVARSMEASGIANAVHVSHTAKSLMSSKHMVVTHKAKLRDVLLSGMGARRSSTEGLVPLPTLVDKMHRNQADKPQYFVFPNTASNPMLHKMPRMPTLPTPALSPSQSSQKQLQPDFNPLVHGSQSTSISALSSDALPVRTMLAVRRGSMTNSIKPAVSAGETLIRRYSISGGILPARPARRSSLSAPSQFYPRGSDPSSPMSSSINLVTPTQAPASTPPVPTLYVHSSSPSAATPSSMPLSQVVPTAADAGNPATSLSSLSLRSDSDPLSPPPSPRTRRRRVAALSRPRRASVMISNPARLVDHVMLSRLGDR